MPGGAKLGAALAAAVAGMAWAVRGRTSGVFGPSVHRGPGARRAIALTFDDGPGPGTPELLHVLARYRARATFFQIGANVLRSPDLARAVSDAGHEIGNHSHTHPNFALRPAHFIADDFARAQDAIAENTGLIPALMRAPYGVRWFGFREMQERLHLLGVMWTTIALDWKLPATAIADRVLSQAAPGGIVCLHDGRGTKPDADARPTAEAVRRIVPALLERGYQFETVSQLLCPSKNP